MKQNVLSFIAMLLILIYINQVQAQNCVITESGLTNILCGNNNTDTDPTDDVISFQLNPIGDATGTIYDVSVSSGSIIPENAEYGVSTTFFLQLGSAGSGDIELTITDRDSSSCTLVEMITDPGSCSDQCNISEFVVGVSECNDNGTITNPTDDRITFDLMPTGQNLSSQYIITASSGEITPDTAEYGEMTEFTLGEGTAGNGEVLVTITDIVDSECFVIVLIEDPGSCSPVCEFTNSGLDNITCDDNGTPANADDDIISFELHPEGYNFSGTYTVGTSPGSVVPFIADFGETTTFTMSNGSAGSGNIALTIFDTDNVNCMILDTIIDPGSCSDQCNILDAGLSNTSCNDNGTGVDDSDDYITFDLNPVGNNIGEYNVTVSSGEVTPTTGIFGTVSSFNLNPGSAGTEVEVTLTSVNDETCSFTVVIGNVGTCSVDCELQNAELSDQSCEVNGTAEPDDDYIIFNLNPTGVNLSEGYTVSVSNGIISPQEALYGVATTFRLNNGSIGAGDVVVTIVDNNSSSCSIEVMILDPGVCEGECQIETGGLQNISCNDNGTPQTSNDDYIRFSLHPQGVNLSDSFRVESSLGLVEPAIAPYGVPTEFRLIDGSAGGGTLIINIIDQGGNACTLEQVITDPGACSNTCNLEDAGFVNLMCNDNSTPKDPNDDYMTFELNPIGSFLSDSYIVSVDQGIVSPDTAFYGSSTLFSLQEGSAGDGNITITLTDINGEDCQISIPITDTGVCSDEIICEVTGREIFFTGDSLACVTDTIAKEAVFSTSGIGDNYFYLLLNEEDSIIDVLEDSLSLLDLPAGDYTVIGIALLNDTLTMTSLSDTSSLDCYELSSNEIEITILDAEECVSGIEDIALDLDWKVFPNPAENSIHVAINEISDYKNASLLIYNANGQLIHQIPDIRQQVTNIYVVDDKPGLYIIKLKTDQGVTYKKYMKL